MDTQTKTTTIRQSAVPWWAAFGAPLMGVPLLVLLLALGSPQTPEKDAMPSGDAAFSVEQVEPLKSLPVEAVMAAPAPEALSRC